MRRYFFALALALLPIGPAAHADTTFNLFSHQGDGSIIEGYVDINTTAGSIDFADLTYSPDGSFKGVIETFMRPVQQFNYHGYYYTAFPAFTGSVFTGYYYDLRLPVPSLVGYGGGPICSVSAGGCGGDLSTTELNGEFYGDAEDGTLSPNEAISGTSITPEPSSFALLCTGLLGVAASLRRGRLASRL